jgi:class 3 adenylate cyclase
VYLSTQELEFVIKSFWEQMSFTIEKYEELIFKYVGDAVIAIFVSNNDVACRHAIECGQDLVKTLKILSTQSLLRKEFQVYQSSLESIMAMLWWFPLETMST